MKVLIIIPYFGSKPPWLDYFLLSCSKNPGYNWLLCTDFQLPENIPQNVKVEQYNLKEFSGLISEKLSIDIHLTHPYKLCDFRPAFGILFSDYIQGYDFWGYSDLDLVYGNISNLINRKIFDENDIITTKQDYLAGHFTLFRNADFINNLFRKIYRVTKKLQDSNSHYCLDERSNLIGKNLFRSRSNKIRLLIWRKMLYWINGLNLVSFDISEVVNREVKRKKIKRYVSPMVRSDYYYQKIDEKWRIAWKDGKLVSTGTNDELLYFHFLKSKHSAKFNIAAIKRHTNSFTIDEQGIHS